MGIAKVGASALAVLLLRVLVLALDSNGDCLAGLADGKSAVHTGKQANSCQSDPSVLIQIDTKGAERRADVSLAVHTEAPMNPCATCSTCVAVPEPSQAGITDQLCMPCANDGQWWWPCNTDPAQCQCGGGGGETPVLNPCATCSTCVAVPQPSQAGVTDETCRPCAQDEQWWWPCNTEQAQCQCRDGGVAVAPPAVTGDGVVCIETPLFLREYSPGFCMMCTKPHPARYDYACHDERFCICTVGLNIATNPAVPTLLDDHARTKSPPAAELTFADDEVEANGDAAMNTPTAEPGVADDEEEDTEDSATGIPMPPTTEPTVREDEAEGDAATNSPISPTADSDWEEDDEEVKAHAKTNVPTSPIAEPGDSDDEEAANGDLGSHTPMSPTANPRVAEEMGAPTNACASCSTCVAVDEPSQAKWHLAPSGATTCDYGEAALPSECEAAVLQLASASGVTPARNMQTGNGGTCDDGAWGSVPLGCSAQTGGDWAAHYKTSGINCNGGPYQMVCSQAKWHLAPSGATTCDYGEAALPSECEAAVLQLASASGVTPARNMQTGNGGTCDDGAWGSVPLGCSAQTGGDWSAHYKTSGINCNGGGYQMVCSQAQARITDELCMPCANNEQWWWPCNTQPAQCECKDAAPAQNPCATCSTCAAVPEPSQAGITDQLCRPCANGGQLWWPCNTEPAQCQCGSSTPTPENPAPSSPTTPPPTTPPVAQPTAPSSIESWFSKADFEQFFPNINNAACSGANFFTYEAFIQATKSFPTFANTGNRVVDQRELAAFFGQTSHETTGGWPTAPGGPFAWGYCFKEEAGCERGGCTYCVQVEQYPCVAGQRYYGRGPMQLSYNYNYGPFSEDTRVFGDKMVLLSDPGRVASDPRIAFMAGLWFWMTPQPPKPSCHDVMSGAWQPTAADQQMGRVPGYGMVTNIINGGLECDMPTSAKVEDRVGFYRRYAGILGVQVDDSSLYCDEMASYR